MALVGLRPLRHRTFALFWAAGATSDIGTWVQLAAIGSLVAVNSDSALAVALVAAATFAPQGLCSPIGGLLADRFDRRRLFLTTLAVQTAATTVLAIVVAGGASGAAVLSPLVVVQSGAGAMGAPALQAILPDLVPREELTAAVSLGLLGWNTGRVLGPLLAAMLVRLGTQWAVGVNAISFAVLWVAIFVVRRAFPPAHRHRKSAAHELRDGARAMRRTPGCFAALTTMMALHFAYIPFIGLVPATARALARHRDGSVTSASVTSVTGWLFSTQGIGAIAGALVLATLLTRTRRSTIVLVGLAAISLSIPAYAFATTLAVAAVFIGVLGGSGAAMFGALTGVVQRDAPPEERGRVLSWFQGTVGACYGAGLWVAGSAVDRFGLHPTMVYMGVSTGAIVVVAWLSPHWRPLIDDEDGAYQRAQIAQRLAPREATGQRSTT